MTHCLITRTLLNFQDKTYCFEDISVPLELGHSGPSLDKDVLSPLALVT